MAQADAEAAVPTSYTSVAGEEGSSEEGAEGAADGDAAARPAPVPAASGGTLASDEALQALRDKLSGGGA